MLQDTVIHCRCGGAVAGSSNETETVVRCCKWCGCDTRCPDPSGLTVSLRMRRHWGFECTLCWNTVERNKEFKCKWKKDSTLMDEFKGNVGGQYDRFLVERNEVLANQSTGKRPRSCRAVAAVKARSSLEAIWASTYKQAESPQEIRRLKRRVEELTAENQELLVQLNVD